MKNNNNSLSEYCILNFNEVFLTLADIVKCKICDGNISFHKGADRGLGFNVYVKCSCSEQILASSPKTNRAFEVNRKFIFVMRLLKMELDGINLFCSLMDICSGISKESYYTRKRY